MRALSLFLALLLTSSAAAQDPLVVDTQKLAASQNNDDRFTVLTGILRARGIDFTVEPFTLDKQVGSEPRTTGRNIVATFGDGPNEVVLGAHYDAARLPDGSLSMGAVDNAASSVMLAGVAEALRARPPQGRVRVVWFDMEELGLAGSTRYLQAHAGDRIRAMLNFDINGYGDTAIFGAPAGGDTPQLRRAMVQTCAELAVDCVRFAGMPPGDDRTFGRAGIPTLSIAHLPAVEVHQLWLLLHAGGAGLAPGTTPPILGIIHTADDVMSKVDGATIARAQRLALALIQNVTAGLD
jgi:hypothetical protein